MAFDARKHEMLKEFEFWARKALQKENVLEFLISITEI